MLHFFCFLKVDLLEGHSNHFQYQLNVHINKPIQIG